jgi:hypothetical protein
MRIGVRLAVFAVVLATAFGGAYALGSATTGDSPAPVTTEHDMTDMSDHGDMTDHSDMTGESTVP